MKATIRLCLGTLCIMGGTMHGSENPSTTSEQISQAFATISTSTNPALDPVKDALAELGGHASKRRGPDSGDAAPAGAHLINRRAPKTPFTTPSKSGASRRNLRRPTRLQDEGIGLGNLLSNFEPLPDQHSGSGEPLLQEEIETIVQSITKLEALSTTLLNKKNELTEQEKKAVEFINKNSKQALNPNTISAAILGAGIFGALAWVARINPVRIYQKECTKFTGLEFPALIAAGKALIGPVVAIIGLGIFWYKFKQWIVEPYKQAHKTELERINQENRHYRTEVDKAIAEILRQTKEEHEKTLRAITDMRKKTDEVLDRSEQTTRQQLAHTLTEVGKSEAEIKAHIAKLTEQLQGALATHTTDLAGFKNDVQALTNTNKEMQQKVDQAMRGQAVAVELVKKIKGDSEKLKQLLASKNIIAPSPSSPASAPVVGGRSPSPGLPIPHSANVPGRWFGKRSSKIAPSPSSTGLSPLPELSGHLTVNTQTPSSGESKRAPASAPAAVTE